MNTYQEKKKIRRKIPPKHPHLPLQKPQPIKPTNTQQPNTQEYITERTDIRVRVNVNIVTYL